MWQKKSPSIIIPCFSQFFSDISGAKKFLYKKKRHFPVTLTLLGLSEKGNQYCIVFQTLEFFLQ